MDYQSGINPDLCLCPTSKKNNSALSVCCFHHCVQAKWLVGFLFKGRRLMEEECVFSWLKLLFQQLELLGMWEDHWGRLLSTVVCLSPPLLRAWLAAELTDCLDGWLPLSLDSHCRLTYTLWASPRLRKREERSCCSGFWKVGSWGFSLFLVWSTARWEQRRYLTPSPPALTTDHLHCAASMTLHAWLVSGFGFILVWTLCLTQGE